jgi:hypothetical protein
MKDMLITPLLIFQVAWERREKIILRTLAAIALLCSSAAALYLLFTFVDTLWGI